MGKKKIVIDTNLFISALGWGGKPKQIIDRVIDGEFKLIIPKTQLEEIKNVLEYPKFYFSKVQKQRFLELVHEIATIIETKEIKDICDDPKDCMILEPANEIKIDYIITGDDDLLRIEEYNAAKIILVSDFLSLISSDNKYYNSKTTIIMADGCFAS